MKGLSRKALAQVPITFDVPPCSTMEQLYLADLLFCYLAEHPLTSFRRPVTDIERATFEPARKSDFVLVERFEDAFSYSYGSGVFEMEAAR